MENDLHLVRPEFIAKIAAAAKRYFSPAHGELVSEIFNQTSKLDAAISNLNGKAVSQHAARIAQLAMEIDERFGVDDPNIETP